MAEHEADSQAAALLAWSLVTRGLGAVYAVSFTSIAAQIVPLAGARGIGPLALSVRGTHDETTIWAAVSSIWPEVSAIWPAVLAIWPAVSAIWPAV